MRNSILVTTLAATLAWGTLHSPATQAADVRVVVDLGDVIYDSGVPYYRVTREPVYVVYENNTPTYYRVISSTSYKGKSAPPPWAPAYGWRAKNNKNKKLYHGYYDARGVWHWD